MCKCDKVVLQILVLPSLQGTCRAISWWENCLPFFDRARDYCIPTFTASCSCITQSLALLSSLEVDADSFELSVNCTFLNLDS